MTLWPAGCAPQVPSSVWYGPNSTEWSSTFQFAVTIACQMPFRSGFAVPISRGAW